MEQVFCEKYPWTLNCRESTNDRCRDVAEMWLKPMLNISKSMTPWFVSDLNGWIMPRGNAA